MYSKEAGHRRINVVMRGNIKIPGDRQRRSKREERFCGLNGISMLEKRIRFKIDL